jgi:hypothetical protein
MEFSLDSLLARMSADEREQVFSGAKKALDRLRQARNMAKNFTEDGSENGQKPMSSKDD